MSNEKILVTGGAGFIGSHLCERLLQEGFSVFCLDNLDDYYDQKIKKQNLKPLLSHEKFVFIQGDIRNIKLVDKIFRKQKINLVIHLAAKAGVRPSIQKPIEYADVNILGTMVILEACRKYRVKKIIFASSSSVYGKTRAVRFSENDPADRPLSPYGATKRAGELICHAYHHLYGIDMICLRFFTVYGPRQRPDLAIHKFTRMMAESKSIPVFGKGDSRRDYTYVDDIIGGIVSSLELLFDTEKPLYEVVNLGSSNPVPLWKLINLLEHKTGFKKRIKRFKEQPGDLPSTFANIGKAKKMLSYKPRTGIKPGINNFVDWFVSLNSKSR